MNVNIYLRTISRIDDVKMVRRWCTDPAAINRKRTECITYHLRTYIDLVVNVVCRSFEQPLTYAMYCA